MVCGGGGTRSETAKAARWTTDNQGWRFILDESSLDERAADKGVFEMAAVKFSSAV